MQVYRIKVEIFQKLFYGIINSFVSEASLFIFGNLADKGILRMGDLISDNNELIIKNKIGELILSPLDTFGLVSLIDALPCSR